MTGLYLDPHRARIHRGRQEVMIVDAGELECSLVHRLLSDAARVDAFLIAGLAINRLRRLNVVSGEETATTRGRASVAEPGPPRDRGIERAIAAHNIGREGDDVVLGIESKLLADTQASVVRVIKRHGSRLLRCVKAATGITSDTEQRCIQSACEGFVVNDKRERLGLIGRHV